MNISVPVLFLLVSYTYACDIHFIDACGTDQIDQVQSQLQAGLVAAIRGNATSVLKFLLPIIKAFSISYDVCSSDQIEQVQRQIQEGLFDAVRRNDNDGIELLLSVMKPDFMSYPGLIQCAIESGREASLRQLLPGTPYLGQETGLELAQLAISAGFSYYSVKSLCLKAHNPGDHQVLGEILNDKGLLLRTAKGGYVKLLAFLGEHWIPHPPDVERILADGAKYDELTGRLETIRDKSRNFYSYTGNFETPSYTINLIIGEAISDDQIDAILVLLTPAFTRFLTPLQILFQYSQVLAYLERTARSTEFTRVTMQAIKTIDTNVLEELLNHPELIELEKVYKAKEMYLYLYCKFFAILPKELRQHIVAVGMSRRGVQLG